MKTKCPTCSSPVKIEGRTTMYYVPEYKQMLQLIEKLAGALEWAESDIAVLTTDLHGKYNAKHQSLIRVKEALQEYRKWKGEE